MGDKETCLRCKKEIDIWEGEGWGIFLPGGREEDVFLCDTCFEEDRAVIYALFSIKRIEEYIKAYQLPPSQG